MSLTRENSQLKAASLVAIAVWLAGAAEASSLIPRVAPVPDAAAAHVLIQPLLSPTLCITSNTTSSCILSPCTGDSTQIWGVNAVSGNIVQFQNAADNGCLAIAGTAAFNGQPLFSDTCNHPTGPNSNSEWDASQTIMQGKLPLVVTALNNRAGFSDTGFCLNSNGTAPIMMRCNGGFSQTWLMVAA